MAIEESAVAVCFGACLVWSLENSGGVLARVRQRVELPEKDGKRRLHELAQTTTLLRKLPILPILSKFMSRLFLPLPPQDEYRFSHLPR